MLYPQRNRVAPGLLVVPPYVVPYVSYSYSSVDISNPRFSHIPLESTCNLYLASTSTICNTYDSME